MEILAGLEASARRQEESLRRLERWVGKALAEWQPDLRLGPTETAVPEAETDRCAFCRRKREQVAEMVAGLEAAICGDCIQACQDTLGTHRRT